MRRYLALAAAAIALLPRVVLAQMPNPSISGAPNVGAAASGGGGMATDASNAVNPTALTNLGGMAADASNATKPTALNNMGTGLTGQAIANWTYGSVGAPFPTDPTFGYGGARTALYATPGVGLADPITAAYVGDSHLAAGTRGISVGGLFRAYNDGTWGAGGSINAGSVGAWTEGHSSKGGAVYALEALAQSDTTAIASSAQGIEIDTAFTSTVGAKYGLAINSAVGDTGAITGTLTVQGGAVIPSGSGIIVTGTCSGCTYPYALLTVQQAGFFPPIPATGSLWRSGGFTAVNGLDWPDMTFSGNSLNLPNFTVSGAGAVAGANYSFGSIGFASNGGGYTSINNGSGTAGAITLGPTGDPTNYYDRTTHLFRTNGGAATVATLTASGLQVGAAPTGGAPGAGNINLGGGSILNNGTVPTGTGAYVRADSPVFTTAVTLPATTATSITGLSPGVNPSDAVNMAQLNGVAGGSTWHASAQAATTANLTVTAAGTGVGHTLTNNGALAALVLDGYTVLLNDRVLVKNQTTQKDNGIYTQTTVGTGAIAWVLTRATDFDQASAAEVAQGATLIVINGTTSPGNLNSQWVETGVGPFTVDTTAIVFSRITADPGGTITAGTINQFAVYPGAGTTVSGVSFTGLMKGNGASAPGVYAGSSCTNQFVRSLDLNGAATCGSILNTDITAGTIDLTTKVTGILPVANGGSGAATFTANGFLTGNTTSAFNVVPLTGIVKGNGASAPTAVTAPAGAIVGTSDTQNLTNKTDTDPIETAAHVGTTGFTATANTTLQTLPGLDQTFTASGSYSCEGFLHFTGTAPTSSNGAKIALVGDGTVSATTAMFNAQAFTSTGTVAAFGTATALGSTAFAATVAMTDISFNAALKINVGGVIHVQLAQNAASGTTASTAGMQRWECHRAS